MLVFDQYFPSLPLDRMEELASILANHISSWDNYGMILLSGPLGSGKTTLVRLTLQRLGIQDIVNSPTFAIMNEYEWKVPNNNTIKIFHFDFYRLNHLEEIQELGFEELWGKEGHSFIEWYDRFQLEYPYPQIHVHWEEIQDIHTRNIRIQEFNDKVNKE